MGRGGGVAKVGRESREGKSSQRNKSKEKPFLKGTVPAAELRGSWGHRIPKAAEGETMRRRDGEQARRRTSEGDEAGRDRWDERGSECATRGARGAPRKREGSG